MNESDLEKRLRSIVESFGTQTRKEGEPHYHLEETVVKQLMAAIKDAGYIHSPDVEIVTRWERGEKPELFMVNGQEVMTGQEFYQRFEKELKTAIDETVAPDAKYTLDDITYLDDFGAKDILNIARRAAGIEE